jgi:hypothetical protein
LKARITYPRTGYVARPQPFPVYDEALISPADSAQFRKQKVFRRWVFGPLAMFLAASYVTIKDIRLVITLAASLWLLLLRPSDQKPAHFSWYHWYQVLVVAAYGALITFLPVSAEQRAGASTAALGVSLTVVGIVELCRYLAKHPVTRP